MGNDDDGLAELVYLEQEVHYLDAHARVDVSGGLVRDYDLGIVRKGAGECDALLLTARKLVREAGELVGQIHGVEYGGHAALDQP